MPLTRAATAVKPPYNPLNTTMTVHQKRTLEGIASMSALCHKQTHAPQQKFYRYSTTSSALNKIEGGTVRPSALAILTCTAISNFTGT